jgi:gliding motility-associated-like protein
MKQLKLFIVFFSLTFTVARSQSIGGATAGSTAFCTSSNAGFISLSGYTGTILFWEASTNSGNSWNNIGNQTSTQSYFNLAQTTWYRAIVKSGSFPTDTSTVSKITIHVAAKGGTITGDGNFCMNSGTGNLSIVGSTGTINYWETSTDNGNNWTIVQNTLTTLAYSNITSLTMFRAVVSNTPGCPTDTSSTGVIKIDQNTVEGTVSGNDTLCFGTKNNLLILSGHFGEVLDWQRSDNNTNWQSLMHSNDSMIISNSVKTIFYKSVVKNGVCPALVTPAFRVYVPEVNPAFAGDDQTILLNEKITLNGNGNGRPIWKNDSLILFSDQFAPVVSPEKSKTYTLTITDAFSCVTSDSVRITVIVPVPNAITPNNDGVNDYFVIDKIEKYSDSKLMVFNKWGDVVFTAAPYTNNFNGISSKGKELPDEIYYYVLDLGNGDKPRKDYILIKR